MDVDAAQSGTEDDLFGEDLAEGRNDNQIGREIPESGEKGRVPHLFRLEDRQAEIIGQELDRRGRRRPSAPLGAVRLRDDADDGIAVFDETCQGRDGESGCPHEKYARFGHGSNLLHEIDRIHIHLDLQAVTSGSLHEFLREEMERTALLSPKEELPAVPSPDP